MKDISHLDFALNNMRQAQDELSYYRGTMLSDEFPTQDQFNEIELILADVKVGMDRYDDYENGMIDCFALDMASFCGELRRHRLGDKTITKAVMNSFELELLDAIMDFECIIDNAPPEETNEEKTNLKLVN